MTTFIAYANTDQIYPEQIVPPILWGNKPQFSLDNVRVKQRYLCQRLAYFLLYELSKIAQIDLALLDQVYRTASGRPQFALQHIDFNISHSDKWVAVILNVEQSAKSAVGIDIEFVKKSRNYAAILAHFASTLELDWFAKQQDKQLAFYRIWCLREAILKSQGVGIVKLSEVEHLPEQQMINSIHCPEGQLIFSSELPFYLAAFSSTFQMQDIHYFSWQKEKLVPLKLNNVVNYSVNFS